MSGNVNPEPVTRSLEEATRVLSDLGMIRVEGETAREVESLDEQALQEQAQFELFMEDPPEDSWKPSPPEAFRVFREYDDLTGDFDE